MFLKGKTVIKSNKGENLLNRKGLAVGFVLLLFVSSSFVGVSNQQKEVTIEKPCITPVGSSMNFIWPLYGHDAQNTCQSEYAAGQNEGYDKWKYFIAHGTPDLVVPVIDSNGTLYTTSFLDGLYVINSNGTLRWHRELYAYIEYQPVIGQDGTIYVGTIKRFQAFYPNGTLKWVLPIEKNFCCDPVISPNGTVYVGTDDGYLFAVNPNGTIQWQYYLGYSLNGASLDSQGKIYLSARYCDYLCCLFPNGTLHWTFRTIVDTSDAPLIGKDGTIYTVPTYDVIGINPDGTEKWRTPVSGAGRSPSLSPNGSIIYSSHDSGDVVCMDPNDGHILWSYNIGLDPLSKSRATVSSDGMIFFAYTDKPGHLAYLCALNPDGSLRWTSDITSDVPHYYGVNIGPAPSIGADGTVYITTWFSSDDPIYHDFGYVHAFGQLDPNAPSPPTITGNSQGKIGEQYKYTLMSTSPLAKDIYYYIQWGDDSYTNWTGPFRSGEPLNVNHSWEKWGTYTVRARARDIDNRWGPWGILTIKMPLSYNLLNKSFWETLFERFPNAFPFLRYLFEK